MRHHAHLAHDYPISYTITQSHARITLSRTRFQVGLDGVFAVMAEKRREEHG